VRKSIAKKTTVTKKKLLCQEDDGDEEACGQEEDDGNEEACGQEEETVTKKPVVKKRRSQRRERQSRKVGNVNLWRAVFVKTARNSNRHNRSIPRI
jgi:hypothetical protein